MSRIGGRTSIVDNVLTRYEQYVQAALARVNAETVLREGEFSPGHRLPVISPARNEFFSASQLAFVDLGCYQGKRLTLLDLMRNPRTKTTKTYPSLVIVARAVCHILDTGESIMIVSPSSGNKATALRDAVMRAIECGLVSPDQLRIAVVLPANSRDKFWASPLSEHPMLSRRNPVAIYEGSKPDEVKRLALGFVESHAAPMWHRYGIRLWHTLDINNYKVADVVRACAEDEFLTPSAGARLHVHAVSSAFGLLGHHLGTTLLAAAGHKIPEPRYFLVQHLGTPDMVLHLYHESTMRDRLPAYRLDKAAELYRQDEDPHFPAATEDVNENLDPTFYTHHPATAPQMTRLIRDNGGGGIVVSRHECLSRYAEIKNLLAGTNVCLPNNPGNLREWSLVMAMTGVLNGIDRGLVADQDILVHGTGSYHAADYQPIPPFGLRQVRDIADLTTVVAQAVVEPTVAS